ncbi:MAG TPA: tRNA (adenosine(37)-N6)-threonylcarbamoyltransferase complex dimerization subunit type 1 TsaB [Gemmatimonadales bacterium]|nr:tRNA (adenosine(37)-N6)-threonylcarbamoyltransferase complex dimerization subunit type 1 TsaB [Gemmatimonadales bacterium]
MSGPWLALETATDIASVALGTADRVRAARSVSGARQHAAQIVELIDQVLTMSAARVDEIAGIVVGDGPGSFTGLRIGWAAAKGLAEDRSLPLRAVPSLMGAAYAAAQGEVGPVAACFDALRGQVFGAVYAFPPGRVETLVAPGLFTVPALARVSPVRPLVAVGDGAVRYGEEVVAWTGRAAGSLTGLGPMAAALLALAPRNGAGRAVEDPGTAEPLYGRPAEAQARWEARHGRPLPRPSR